jgi:hypothetical protein
VLFQEQRNGRLRPSRPVVGAYAFVSSLHALWDWAPGFAIAVSRYASGRGGQLNRLGVSRSGCPLGRGQIALDRVAEDAILVAVASIGLFTVHRRRMRALAADYRLR